ncbi:MAG: DUF2007 domain-containing protein [Actinobacteria bacterium]|nr:DUF2007 domain-containing protein [Actinomycetota bacterium]
MMLITTVSSSFEARVVAARLGAAGILTELKGLSEGPYPLPWPVDILVPADQFDEARDLMMDAQVEEIFDQEL